MRLIDADEVHNLIRNAKKYMWTSPISIERKVTVSTDDIQFGIDKISTVDAVKVVRCCDCRHFRYNLTPDGYLPDGVKETECLLFHFGADYTDFCSYGEKENKND